MRLRASWFGEHYDSKNGHWFALTRGGALCTNLRMKKPFRFAFAALSLLTFISTAHAVTPSEHYSLAFSASVYSAVSSGTDAAALKVTKVSNGTIFNQLVASGSFSGETAADMAMVLNLGGTSDLVDVIDKSTHAILFPLMTSGTDPDVNASVLYGHANGKVAAIETSSFIVNLPDGRTFNAAGLFRATGDGVQFTPLLNAGVSFMGGGGSEVIVGSFRKHGKTYSY
jgi:hypothetical protein